MRLELTILDTRIQAGGVELPPWKKRFRLVGWKKRFGKVTLKGREVSQMLCQKKVLLPNCL